MQFLEKQWKMWRNIDIKLVTTDRRRNYLVSEPSYHTTKKLAEYPLATEMKKAQILMSKPVFLGLSILELSKTLMYEFWYDYVKPKYVEKAKFCYMNTDSFIVFASTTHPLPRLHPSSYLKQKPEIQFKCKQRFGCH